MTTLAVAYDTDRTAWVLRPFEGDGRFVFYIAPTKQPAIDTAVKVCQLLGTKDRAVELYVLTKTGRIQDRRTYGHDPRRSRG